MEQRILPTIDQFMSITGDKVRYCDTDRQGHVNNAIFSSFLETGRVEILYNQNHPLYAEGCSFVIASLKLDFIDEILWPGEIQIGTKIARIGRSSITIEQGLYQNGNCVALAETVIVQMDGRSRKSSPLPDSTVAVLGKYLKA